MATDLSNLTTAEAQALGFFVCGRCFVTQCREQLSRHYWDNGDLCHTCRVVHGNYTLTDMQRDSDYC